MKCEFCNSEHQGSYGSGRFCNSKCSRSFSSISKREEKNRKISEKLKGRLRTRTLSTKNCIFCNDQFTTLKNANYCSKKCASRAINAREDVKEKHRISRLQQIEKGNIGYGIKTEYNGIRCDSVLEFAFLKKYFSENPEASVERFKGFLELEDGKKYQPDFIINNKIIVEVKYTTPYIGERLSEKWKSYVSSQEIKKECLSAMSKNGYEFLWITEKDIGNSFYRKCLSEVKLAKNHANIRLQMSSV